MQEVSNQSIKQCKRSIPMNIHNTLSFKDMLNKLSDYDIVVFANECEKEDVLQLDKDILKEEFFGCHPCINTSSLKIKTADVIEKIIPATKHDKIIVEL